MINQKCVFFCSSFPWADGDVGGVKKGREAADTNFVLSFWSNLLEKKEEKKLPRIANEIIKSVGCYYASSVQGRAPRFEHATPGLVSASDDDKTLAPDSTTSQAKRGADGLDPFISFYSNLSCTHDCVSGGKIVWGVNGGDKEEPQFF